MLGNFLKIDHTVVCLLKLVNFACLFIWNDRLSGKQVGSQASRLAWIQPVCISINAVPALKGLTLNAQNFSSVSIFKVFQCRSKMVKMLYGCQTAWIWMRRQVTRRVNPDPSCLHMELQLCLAGYGLKVI